jgi:AcrR family transcriptional regulator
VKPLDPVKEERIIDAVYVIAGKRGLAGIDITGISKEAGVGVGTLYTYFKNKEEIILEAFLKVENKVTQKMFEQLDLSRSTRDSLKRIYVNMLNYRLEHYNETVFIDQYFQSNYMQIDLSKQLDTFLEKNKPLYELLIKGQENGEIVKADLLILIGFIIGTNREFSNGIVQKVYPLTDQTVEDSFNLVWKGLKE